MKALAVALVMLVGAAPGPLVAYQKLGVVVGDTVMLLKWDHVPVRYFIADRGVAGVSPPDLHAAVERAFATWQAVPTASVTYAFVGYTAASPDEEDGINVIGFVDRPDLDRVLASTSLLVDDVSGQLVESDIFFNAAFQWSVAAAGEKDHYDLQTIAVHEIGHLSGLGHSALGETELVEVGRRVIATETVMFPIAFPAGTVSDRALRADDIAGISDLYPENAFTKETGSLSGRVIKNGGGVFGAHVIAFNPKTRTLIAGFTLDANGHFSIGGLSPGPHVVRVEPLDDGEVDSFFEASASVDIDFRVGFSKKIAAVPRGGDSGSVEIAVVSK